MTSNNTSASSSNPSGESEDLFQSFENAFFAMLQPISSQISSHVYENDEIKANNENIQRFLETVRQLDKFFLQNRALFAAKSPEAIRLEEINDLKLEIAKKEQALQRYNEKLARWIPMANDLAQGKMPNFSQPIPIIPNAVPSLTTPLGQRLQQGGIPLQPGMIPRQNPQLLRPQGLGMMPQNHLQFANQGGPSSGPLANLERTTSNIGTSHERK